MKRLILATTVLMGVLAANAAKVASVAVKYPDGGTEGLGDAWAQCQVKAGDEYDPSQCSRDVGALRATGAFDNITVDVKESVDGVVVTYVVKRKMRFQGPLRVKGNEYWNDGKIGKLSELKDGYPYGEQEFAAAAKRIAEEYKKKFFSDVKVNPVVTPAEGLDGFVTVTMEIDEGVRQVVESYEFDGNEAFKDSELRATFGSYPWWNPMGWFNSDPARDQELAEARDKVKAFYRDNGYLDAQVGFPTLGKDEKGRTIRTFEVKEGTKYTVGTITVTGVKTYPADVVLKSAKSIKTGEVAGASALAAAAREIEIYCGSGNSALTDTHVTYRTFPREDDPQTADVEFAVKEGVPVQINKIEVRGNDYTMDKVITREIRLSPGDLMLADEAEKAKKRLESLRYFERVRYYMEKVDGGEAKDGHAEKRNLVYEVAERNTGNFLIGIGAGTESSVFGQVEISEINFDLFSPWRFRGAGQKGRIVVQAGPRVQTYEASLTEPWFLDRELELDVAVYRRQRWFDDYDVIRNGASVGLSYPVKFWPTWEAFGRIGFSLAVELVQMDDVSRGKFYNPKTDDDEWRALKEEEHKYDDSVEIPFEVFWRHDTRDRFMFPSSGHNARIYGDVVGGDNNYWRAGFNFRQYFPVWKKHGHVFQIGLRGETVDDFSGGLPIYDRLFLGGSKSIRGVEFREIAPRVYSRENKHGRYVPWGGRTSWCMNMEYSVPIVSIVRFALFSDLGSVGEDEFDLDMDWFCWSVGAGLRLDLESFPIRLDFAVPVVDPDEDVDEKVFSFSIGYDF